MRRFYEKTGTTLGSASLVIVGSAFVLFAGADVAFYDSIWAFKSFRDFEVPALLLLVFGVMLAIVGLVMLWSLISHSAFVEIGQSGFRRAPGMLAPVPWEKVGRITFVKGKRVIELELSSPSDIVCSSWFMRVLYIGVRKKAVIAIATAAYLNGGEIAAEIERYYPDISRES